MTRYVPPADLAIELIAGSVKAAAKDSGASANGALLMVPISALRIIQNFNPRITGTSEYEAGIAQLTASIMAEGFYQDKPITGYVAKSPEDDTKSVIFLTDGHRRLEAALAAIAQGAEIEKLPVLVKPAGTSMEDLTVALTKTGQPLAPYEMAIVVKRLIGYGMTEENVAIRLNITRRYVSDLLLLIGGAAKVRNMVMTGKISATLAIAELRKNGQNAAEALSAAVNAAAASGKARATAKDVTTTRTVATREPASEEAAGDDLNGKWEFRANAGDIVTLGDVFLFQSVANGAWFNLIPDTEGQVKIMQDVSFKLTMRRKPAPVESEAADL